MKKSVLITDTFREISKSKSRFISIAIIVALGTGFFCGIKVTSPDMKNTADKYYVDTNYSDFHIQGTYGITEDDINAVANLDGIKHVQGGYSQDVFVETDKDQAIIRLYSYPTDGSADKDEYMNKPVLVEGRLPQKKNECVIEKSIKTPSSFFIGNTIEFVSGTDDPITDTLTTNYCNIVGVVKSSMYINFERGASQIGNGQLTNFIFLAEDNFDDEVYTDMYVGLEDTFNYSSFSDEYEDLIDEYTDILEDFGEVRSQVRYDEIIDEAMEKIADARVELEDGKQEAAEELADAAIKIADAEKELKDGKRTQQTEVSKAQKELADAKEELLNGQKDYDEAYQEYLDEIAKAQQEIADGWIELADAEKEIADGWQKYYDGLADYQYGKVSGRDELSDGKEKLNQLKRLKSGVDSLNMGVTGLLNSDVISSADSFSDAARFIPNFEQTIIEINTALQLMGIQNQLDSTYPVAYNSALLTAISQELGNQITNAEAQLEAGSDKMDSALDSANDKLRKAYKELVEAEEELEKGRQELLDAEETLKQEIIDAEQEFADAREELADGEVKIADAEVTLNKEIRKSNKEIKDGEEKIADAKQEYNDAVIETNEKIADAEKELNDAEADLAELEKPEWYVWDRTNYPGNGDFGTDADRIDKIATVFPVFFTLVAALICLTTMTRMVEEQRTQIGTFKALGYSDTTIMMKYMLYALIASLTGCFIGMSIGFKLFPLVIFNAYSMMYNLPSLIAPYDVIMIIGSTIVAVICTTVAAYIAGKAELQAQPSELMRPKTPKAGKTIFLEKITWLWKRLSFSYKVTIRNLFRYKGRVTVTVLGIAGCTALMLAGFGLQHSISSIGDRQFIDIFKYQLVGAINDDLTTEDWQEITNTIDASSIIDIYTYVYNKTIDVTVAGQERQATLFVPEDYSNIDEFITFRVRTTHKPLTLNDDGVIINEKFAKLLDVGVNDYVTIKENNVTKDLLITGICENYAYNYVYMTPEYYQEQFGKAPISNTFIANMVEFSEENQNKVASELLKNDNIVGISYISAIGEKFNDLMGSLSIIVVVLIICAGALAFVVLYNLTNINVTERIRELATIKVLGFFDGEVSAYIYRENIISSILGVALGLWLGIYLHAFIIQTAEVEIVMFDPTRGTMSYVYSALLTMLFTFIVNFVLHFRLKKIDMVESLKSVE
ncbi:MAG: ABC transporter permease [Erysipelotrichales bacterium]|nr:ABC transporter permease [Erysipelotrichales bacterium]